MNRRELNASLLTSAEFYRDKLGDWEPREGEAQALVDAEWLLRLLREFGVAARLRNDIRQLARASGFDVVDPDCRKV